MASRVGNDEQYQYYSLFDREELKFYCKDKDGKVPGPVDAVWTRTKYDCSSRSFLSLVCGNEDCETDASVPCSVIPVFAL